MHKFLLVGLGNIGAEYHHTRHNIGFDVLDAFVRQHNAFFQSSRLADVAQLKWKGRTLVCIKPTTYMNLSGKAFKYWLDKENLDLAQTLTIVDELAIPLDALRLRGSGGAAGHNGLRDIELTLGTQDYARLRFGLGNDFPKGQQVDFVLGRWKPSEQGLVDQKIKACGEIIEAFCTQGLQPAMNLANSWRFTH
jgi:peptidyl-tRNA hydrolase, PTH1 family